MSKRSTESELGARRRHYIPLNAIIPECSNLTQPNFGHCNIVWGNCNKGLSEKLQMLPNCTAHLLMHAIYDDNLIITFRN